MLAVKMHKRKRPWLGYECYLLPVVRWDIADRQIRSWVHTLTRGRGARNPEWPNDQIRYLTLVKVPEGHPVKMYSSWFFRCLNATNESFRPLRDWDREVKDAIGRWDTDRGTPCWSEPEMILGAPLPARQILWTKDIRLLRQDVPKTKKPRKYRERLDE